jgi:hypothetical protein
MIAITRLLLAAALSFVKSRSRLQAEIVVLRHQLNVLRRAAPRRIRLSNSDRLLLVWLYRLWPGLLRTLAILRPETVVRWHREGFRAYWRWKSRGKPGRPTITKNVRNLIREISRANPLWGAPRIHGELLKLGIDVRAVDRGEVHGEASPSALAVLADVPPQPRGRNRVN